MLHTKLFRSTVAHGLIKTIDTARAAKLPGVFAVVTIDDVKTVLPDPYYGPAFHDQPILADGKVRYVGEPVAAVLADDPHVADQAVQLITADYEELPAVYDEIEALTTQVFVHDQLKPAGTFPDLKHLKGVKDTNIALDYRLRLGDFETAYAAAEHKFEHEFKTQKVLHVPFEPFASIADTSVAMVRQVFCGLFDRYPNLKIVTHHPWIEPSEWLGAQAARAYPLHLVSSQPRYRLHSQMDSGPISARGKP